jgi:hypothetical protein
VCAHMHLPVSTSCVFCIPDSSPVIIMMIINLKHNFLYEHY